MTSSTFPTSTTSSPTSTSYSTTPLTTFFTPLTAPCFQGPWLVMNTDLGTVTAQANPFLPCIPNNGNLGFPYYSPGVCPSDWVVAVSGNISYGDFLEYHSTCCPSHMSYLNGISYCGSIGTTPVLVSKNITTDLRTSPSTVVLVAQAISVAWKPSELDIFTPKSAPLIEATNTQPTTSSIASTSSTSSTTSNSASHSSSSETTQNRRSKHLSPASQAGLSIGVIIAALLILTSGWLLFRKRRRTRAKKLSQDYSKPELSATEEVQKRLAELDNERMIGELASRDKPAEGDSLPRFELDANWAGHEISTSSPKSPKLGESFVIGGGSRVPRCGRD